MNTTTSRPSMPVWVVALFPVSLCVAAGLVLMRMEHPTAAMGAFLVAGVFIVGAVVLLLRTVRGRPPSGEGRP